MKGVVSQVVEKRLMKIALDMNAGGAINWYPGHMAAANKAIRQRLKVADLVVELRDSRIPISSANADLQPIVSSKRRLIVLNKKDLVPSDSLPRWIQYFESRGQDCVAINSHSQYSVREAVKLMEVKLKEVIAREPTLIVMVVGVPNVGKSCLINSIHQFARSRLSMRGKAKRATVGPLPGVTQDIAGFKIAEKPSIYVLDTPGVLVPSITDIETGLKLALAGSVKDSVVGEDRIAEYLLAVLNTQGTPLQWERVENQKAERIENVSVVNDLKPKKKNQKDVPDPSKIIYIKDRAAEVKHSLYLTMSQFRGYVEDENDLGELIEQQFETLQRAFKISQRASEARLMVSKKLLTMFRTGQLGPFILDDVPDTSPSNKKTARVH